MNTADRNSKASVDRHIDKLNFDYMTEEEKVDMNKSATTTLAWSTNSYQNTPSNESFELSIYERQHLLEGYQSFNKFQKSVDWSLLNSRGIRCLQIVQERD